MKTYFVAFFILINQNYDNFYYFQDDSRNYINQEKLTSVIYKLKSIKEIDFAKIDNLNARNMLKAQYEAIDLIEFELLYNDKSSQFTAIENVQRDDNFGYDSAIINSGGEGLYYKNIQDSINIQKTENSGKSFLINHSEKLPNWNILKETKNINGYLCKKATSIVKETDFRRNRELQFVWEVWFTEEIPVSFGPAGLDGLPGLVLEGSKNGAIYFYATKIVNDSSEKTLIKKPTKGTMVTKDEFNKIIIGY